MTESFEREIRTKPSGTQALPGGEYLEWNKSEKGVSLIWSSDKPLTDLIFAADRVLGIADAAHRGLVDFAGTHSSPVTAKEARQLALQKPNTVSFLRLEYPSGIALVWTPTAGTDELEQYSSFAEASVFFDRDHVSLAATAIGLMATRSLVQVADKIAASVTA